MLNSKGFTMVESMIALCIFTLVVGGVLLVYSKGQIEHIKNNHKTELQENLRIALNRISRDIRQARDYIVIYGPDGSPAADGRGTRIKFKNAGGDIIEYSFDGKDKELEVKRGPWGSPTPVASHIEGLEFQYDGAGKVVTVFIKGRKGNTDPPVVQELSTKVLARAL